MPISRVTARWSGFRGAPGYSNFFFAGTSTLPADARLATLAVTNFFYDMLTVFPAGVSIAVDPTVDIIDEGSGNITGQIDTDPVTPVGGNGSAAYSAASGAVVNWMTANYRGGRRIRGKTFLVPLAAECYDDQGDLTATTLSAIRNAAGTLASGQGPEELVVWSRPVNGSGGQTASVTSASVPDLAAILRSRRD